MTAADLTLLPEADQRRLCNAFQFQARYDRSGRRLTLSVAISATPAEALASMITQVTGQNGQEPTAGHDQTGGVSPLVGAPAGPVPHGKHP